MHQENSGIVLDSIIPERQEVSVVLSYTRDYFKVDVPIPSDFVIFLQTLTPFKKKHELCSPLGFYRYGKTEFVR